MFSFIFLSNKNNFIETYIPEINQQKSYLLTKTRHTNKFTKVKLNKLNYKILPPYYYNTNYYNLKTLLMSLLLEFYYFFFLLIKV